MMSKEILVLFALIAALAIKCEVVCSEDELVKEIIEDLEDNGRS